MKISELINTLQYELNSTGDSDVVISISNKNKHKLEICEDIITTSNIKTQLVMHKDKNEFLIRNWE